MAHTVFTNASVVLNGVDLSDHVDSVTMTHTTETLDDTCMGDTYRNRLPGLRDWSAQISLKADFAASEVDATLATIRGLTAPVTLAIRPVNAAISATNPEYTGPVIVTDEQIFGGAVGEMNMSPITCQGAGALVRDITP